MRCAAGREIKIASLINKDIKEVGWRGWGRGRSQRGKSFIKLWLNLQRIVSFHFRGFPVFSKGVESLSS